MKVPDENYVAGDVSAGQGQLLTVGAEGKVEDRTTGEVCESPWSIWED